MPSAALLMGSKNDFPLLKDFITTCTAFGVDVTARVLSAHRTPEQAADFAKNAASNGFDIICAAAGKAAHLAGVLAAHTCLPVIGIPLKSTALDGMDALLSTVQMPPGVPVATVGIDASSNAALLAVRILALKYPELTGKLEAYREKLTKGVLDADLAIQKEAEEMQK